MKTVQSVEKKTPRKHGGKREGAGRPQSKKPPVPHRSRPPLNGSLHPVHATLRVKQHVWNMRSQRSFTRIGHSFKRSRERFGMRLIQFAVLGNHLHLVVEAHDERALGRGMRALEISITKRLNNMMGTRGRVFTERYHSRILLSGDDVANVLRYLRDNHVKHYRSRADEDVFCSVGKKLTTRPALAELVAPPRTWLLRIGWRVGTMGLVEPEGWDAGADGDLKRAYVASSRRRTRRR